MIVGNRIAIIRVGERINYQKDYASKIGVTFELKKKDNKKERRKEDHETNYRKYN